LPVIMISESSNSPTAVISQLVITDTKQGNYNSASALSTLIFLLIFGVAYVMVRFLGADIGGTQEAGSKPKKSLLSRLRGGSVVDKKKDEQKAEIGRGDVTDQNNAAGAKSTQTADTAATGGQR
ncbi:MAG: ABC transporter permease, partial [Corynebacterium urealyticum]